MADAKRRECMRALALEINNRPAIREKRSQSNRDRWKAVVDFLVKYRNGILGLVEIKPAYAVTRSLEKIQAIESFAGEKGWAYGVLTESELFA